MQTCCILVAWSLSWSLSWSWFVSLLVSQTELLYSPQSYKVSRNPTDRILNSPQIHRSTDVRWLLQIVLRRGAWSSMPLVRQNFSLHSGSLVPLQKWIQTLVPQDVESLEMDPSPDPLISRALIWAVDSLVSHL